MVIVWGVTNISHKHRKQEEFLILMKFQQFYPQVISFQHLVIANTEYGTNYNKQGCKVIISGSVYTFVL